MMAKGKNRVQYLGQTGMVQTTTQINLDFLYRYSTSRDPIYNVGDRVALADSRVFRYAKCNAARTTGYCMVFNYRGTTPYVAATNGGPAIARTTNLQTNTVIGDTHIHVTVAATDGEGHDGVFDVDELRGGYLVIFGASNLRENRGIIGNTATTGAGTITIYLDGALLGAHPTTTTLGVEVFPNPWNSLAMVARDSGGLSVAGFPPSSAITTNEYFWVQTWGPCRVSGQNFNAGKTTYQRQLYFGPDGSIRLIPTGGGATGYYQHAGFIIGPTTPSIGSSPFLMLQICP